ncbi:MAG TPA: PaaI family thioesterase [Candidatus Saccharimonadales bacterium]|nr:PaaI family thioesterase [Candidatus Saccharimonadales bacterium]
MARLLELGVDFEHWCFACGRLNPSGLHLDFDVASNTATTQYTATKDHQGYDGALHGGIVTALLDETMGWAIFHQGIWGVTGKITVTFRRPVPLGEELIVTGRVARDRGRAIETSGTVVRAANGETLAEGRALFLRMPEKRRQELEQRYSRSGAAFERVRRAVADEEREHVRT